MLHKRHGQNEHELVDTPAVAESLRAAASAAAPLALPPHPADKGDEHKISVFWRVFGGTILSIAALVGITVYNSFQASITELRADLAREREAVAGMVKKEELDREREARASLAKKDDVDARIKTQYERIRAIEAYKADIEALRERTTGNAAVADAARKETAAAVEALKKDAAGLEGLRERVAGLEGVRKEVAGLEAIREKLGGVCVDLKAAREDVAKLQQELERNKASDLERKTYRDAQAKQLDDTVKELQRGVQDCREKLARLEGAGGMPPPVGPPAPKPAKPAPKGEAKPAGAAKPAAPPAEEEGRD